ncbi:zinc-dependent alcohol dehydrogenase [Desulfosudis oleivorans]|uniref:Alcohol dehydrogenase GroES domain protein n=1 Tax=Desulfosudis oleivorans (strain DSM 6200 / JCM 39069 / Hxd3) TaxID=96561 RepID=A8ZYM3_DESOH|nr:alcohol dehydrogenase catalytic domain-containing protein [Desulfosudis oleivorans]ABW67128.1 Alcohol dehydrogenase GroES domain protein [Desulfosudis oleivorans Hxd3]
MRALELNISPLRFAAARTCAALFGKTSFYRGPGRTVRLVDIPEPSLPGADWVKIQTCYCGLCGSDLNLIMLHDSPSAQPFTSFPCIMGHEFVGRIVEAGAGVQGFATGDAVAVNPTIGCEIRGISPLCPACRAGRPGNCDNQAMGRFSPGMFLGLISDLNGGFAPYVVAHKSQLFHIPDSLALKTAVMTEPVAVALQAVLDNPPGADDTVLVIGGGVIGNLIVQSARVLAPGCRIAVVEPSPLAADLVQDLGADAVVRPGEIFDAAVAMTGGALYRPMLGAPILKGGFDRVYDTVGSSATLNTAMRVTAALGTVSVVGIGSTVKLDPTPLWLKLQTVKGVYAYGMADWQGGPRHVFDIAMELMARGQIQTDRLITHTFRMEEYRRMLAVNMNKAKHGAIKSVVAFVD